MIMHLSDTFELINGVRRYNFQHCCYYLQQQGQQIYGSCFRIYPADYEVIQRLLIYAFQDRYRASDRGIALHKGLLVMGPSGCGKTSLLHLVKPFFCEPQRYVLRNCREISYFTER